MTDFIKVTDDDAWDAIEQGWTPPTTTNADGVVILKKKENWTKMEQKLTKANTKAKHLLNHGFAVEISGLIRGCESANDAWDTLRNQFEGNPTVRRSKLLMLNTQLEKFVYG